MKHIGEIALHGVLPEVFAGMPRRESQVWLADVVFRRGETCLVEAESGVGKSSLCSFIYGARQDYTGTITVDGENLRGFSVRRLCDMRVRHVSLLPQDMRLFPELTVMENIDIKNRLTSWKTRGEVLSMLERLEIAGKADEPARRLSIGQQQRVAVVRALCQPFDFLLLDEPVSHLDARNNSVVAEVIAAEAAAQGAGVIATSVGYDINLDFDRKLKL